MEKRNILIIEDSLYLAESIKDALEMHGFTVHVAPNGKNGLDYAIANHPDLILLDIRLPDISGYEVYHALQKDDWGKKAKVTILTASESIESVSKNVNLPLKFVLFKPNQSLTDIITHIEKRLK